MSFAEGNDTQKSRASKNVLLKWFSLGLGLGLGSRCARFVGTIRSIDVQSLGGKQRSYVALLRGKARTRLLLFHGRASCLVAAARASASALASAVVTTQALAFCHGVRSASASASARAVLGHILESPPAALWRLQNLEFEDMKI
jgi:hypothetical protein